MSGDRGEAGFALAYADPCWRFANWSIGEMAKYGEKWARANGRSPYPVMTTEDICALPVADIMAKDSVMLMWATYPKLQDGLQVMKAWGYDFKTVAFTWIKLNPSGVGWHFGMGFHTRGNAEIILLGTRGKGLKRMDNAIANLLIYPRGGHSAKPPVVRDKIERLYGNVNRVELFARERVKNWSCWGNEVEPSPGTEALWPYIIPPYTAIVDEDEYQGLPVADTIQVSWDYGEQMRMM